MNAGVTASEFTRWGFGVAQEIDKAATTLWLKYRQHDGELDGGPFTGALDAFRYVSTGAIINFDRLGIAERRRFRHERIGHIRVAASDILLCESKC